MKEACLSSHSTEEAFMILLLKDGSHVRVRYHTGTEIRNGSAQPHVRLNFSLTSWSVMMRDGDFLQCAT
jgi:hypothetical protein